jgi:repressor LexA
MHVLQQKLLTISQERNLGQYSLRDIGKMVSESSPQKIKHHLQQLERKGLIRIDKTEGVIEKIDRRWVGGLLKKAKLLTIPILGSANAGPAKIYADANIEGYLRVSTSLLTCPINHRLYALKVSGPSMNKAKIEGKTISDGDYVVIDSENIVPKNNDIVLSLIDGLANIKRYRIDKKNNQILLMSESTQNFPAIYIHEDDDFLINGKVVGVIKQPERGKPAL